MDKILKLLSFSQCVCCTVIQEGMWVVCSIGQSSTLAFMLGIYGTVPGVCEGVDLWFLFKPVLPAASAMRSMLLWIIQYTAEEQRLHANCQTAFQRKDKMALARAMAGCGCRCWRAADLNRSPNLSTSTRSILWYPVPQLGRLLQQSPVCSSQAAEASTTASTNSNEAGQLTAPSPKKYNLRSLTKGEMTGKLAYCVSCKLAEQRICLPMHRR